MVVTGAAGAVGSIAGQIAKIVGCKVIGIAGSRSKCEWLISDLSFDYAIDYKSENVQQILRKVAPNGIDCFFDNVGGELSSVVISLMNDFGRIAVCGSISAYNVNKEITNFPKGSRDIIHIAFEIHLVFLFRSDRYSAGHLDEAAENGRVRRDAVAGLLE